MEPAPSEPENDEDYYYEEEALERRSWVRSVPGWAVSMLFHVVLILVLANVSLSALSENEISALTIAPQSDEVLETVEPLEFEQQELDVMEEIEMPSIDYADAGLASFGDLSAPTELPSQAISVGSGAESTMQEVGALFEAGGEGLSDHGVGDGGAEFFGVKAGGRRFVFLVDSSKSMGGGKFEAACQELLYAISKLEKDQYFYIIFFDHDAARMTLTPGGPPETRCVPATRENMLACQRWVSTVELELKTNVYESFVYALDLLPDAIYVLTDGVFSDRRQLDNLLKSENVLDDVIDGKRPKVAIHTVGFYSRDGEEVLSTISREYGGVYRFVPKPPKIPKR
ncbi:vWA domain-containing protein [Lignipirellula cremea]|uniref:hypothetical protein n=1 Tax=Lignipirellula cremea TaxID=2528010 RepID=UPI0018D25408|nr:hypothetical protein [Lignipirellula cremea]